MNSKQFQPWLVLALVAVAGCSQSQPEQPAPPAPAPAPWQAAAVPTSSVPQVYADVWAKAANRNNCPLVALTRHGQSSAAPRAANFSGGWGVAYDLPNERSAFGVAGTGADPGGDVYDAWPHKRTWVDGSSVGYGPEGGSGPNQLAYLRIAGHNCLYNVWSRLGVAHLEQLLEGIRFVR